MVQTSSFHSEVSVEEQSYLAGYESDDRRDNCLESVNFAHFVVAIPLRDGKISPKQQPIVLQRGSVGRSRSGHGTSRDRTVLPASTMQQSVGSITKKQQEYLNAKKYYDELVAKQNAAKKRDTRRHVASVASPTTPPIRAGETVSHTPSLAHSMYTPIRNQSGTCASSSGPSRPIQTHLYQHPQTNGINLTQPPEQIPESNLGMPFDEHLQGQPCFRDICLFLLGAICFCDVVLRLMGLGGAVSFLWGDQEIQPYRSIGHYLLLANVLWAVDWLIRATALLYCFRSVWSLTIVPMVCSFARNHENKKRNSLYTK